MDVRKTYSCIESIWCDALIEKIPNNVGELIYAHIKKNATYDTKLSISNKKYTVRYESKLAKYHNTTYRMGYWKIPKINYFSNKSYTACAKIVSKHDNNGGITYDRLDFYVIEGQTHEPTFDDELIKKGSIILCKEIDGNDVDEMDVAMVSPNELKIFLSIIDLIT